MQHIHRVALACTTGLILAGCAKKERASTDTTAAAAAMPAPAPAPAPTPSVSLADFAGKWRMRSVPESGKDKSPTNFVLTATADTTGWLITFPSGVKVPVHVMASGDSVVGTTGEFPSQRRKGVKVMTDVMLKSQGGKLAGVTVAHYTTKGADSVLRLTTTGTKMP